MSNIPPPYSNDNYNEISRIIFEKLRQGIFPALKICNHLSKKIFMLQQKTLKQLVKPLNKNFLHKNFQRLRICYFKTFKKIHQ